MEFIGRSARKRKALKVAYDRLLRAHEGVVEFSRSLPSQLDADEPDGSSDRSESYPGHVLAAQVEADRLLASASRRMGEEEELMQELRMIEQNVRELYDDIGRFPRSSSGRKGAVNRYLGAYDEMVEQTQEFVIRAVAGRTAIDQSIEGYLKLGVRYEFELFG